MSETKTIYTVDSDDADAAIDTFRGEWNFLSNFFAAPVEMEGITYPTTEHAFQAMKTHETAERYVVRDSPTPTTAKRRGRKVTLRDGWNTERFAVMEEVLRAKFADPRLRGKLLATGNRVLIEGNTWRDTTWGMVRDAQTGGWRGENRLGKLLMQLRELRAESATNTDTDDTGDAALIALALRMRDRAYAPYSKYHVGAAILAASGAVYGGCNIENASYGLSNCAERTAVFSAVANGERTVTTVVVATEGGGSPCGACRQVLWEFAPKGAPLRVVQVDKSGAVVRETTIAALLPEAFVLQ